jgi:hypothetical protein
MTGIGGLAETLPATVTTPELTMTGQSGPAAPLPGSIETTDPPAAGRGRTSND